MNSNYLPLTEYSSKYKVSISTLRRRIKTKDIKFRFDQGKYLIFDEPTQRPSLDSVLENQPRPSLTKELDLGADRKIEPSAEMPFSFSMDEKSDEPILTAANRLLTELKKAYTQILHEKEEQVLHLKEEVSDLKTLVRVLESENERLKNS